MFEIENRNNHILLEKVFDAGANTIWSEMKKLRGKPQEQKDCMRKRWVWELIQNASDCTPIYGKVNININLNADNYLEFSHDGLPFTYENIIDLITQISSKQSEDNVKTGKFGTGFISTHLLSEKVEVNGILKQDDKIFKPLNFLIDRSGDSYQEVREKIKNTLSLIERVKEDKNLRIQQPLKFNTSFFYDAINSADTKEAIVIGLNDLGNTIPFVLALNPTIESITCDGIKYSVQKRFNVESGNFEIVEVSGLAPNPIKILIKHEKEVYIALLVEQKCENVFKVLSFNENIPKLFCNFPLIGTELFSFPVILNSSMFEVEKDRNAIHEGDRENIDIIKMGIKLYSELIDFACQNQWEDLYNMCFMTKNINSDLQKQLYNAIKKRLEVLPIVEINKEGQYSGRMAMKIKDNDEKQICVPYCDKKGLSDDFWELINEAIKVSIPIKTSYEFWDKIINNRIVIDDINKKFKEKNLSDIHDYYGKPIEDMWKWLNKYYDFWIKYKSVKEFRDEVYVINQNNKFVKTTQLFLDLNIDSTLKNILIDLDSNIKDSLLSTEIKLREGIIERSRDNEFVSKKIQEEVNAILSDETINNTKRSNEVQNLFNRLTDWFLVNPELSEKLFDTLYEKKSLLSPPEVNIRRFKIAEKIESYNIKYEQIDDIINNHNKIGELIDNLDQLSPQEVKEQLKHITKHSRYAKEFLNRIMERTIESVYKYLCETGKYKLPDSLEEWKKQSHSDTVFSSVKNKRAIRIVVRPSDYNKIIFFNEEEYEALDDVDYELWTSNGEKTKMVTLGHIIKTTGITVIPLRDLFND
jgi:hypothetical protein